MCIPRVFPALAVLGHPRPGYCNNALSKARFEPSGKIDWPKACPQGDLPVRSANRPFSWEDQFNLSFAAVTAREFHDERRRLVGAETDCAKRSPQGEPAVRRLVYPTQPQDGAKSAHACSMKISKDACEYFAEQAVSKEEVVKRGMEQKSKKFVKAEAEVHAKA